jgi:hypothetical protein
MAEPGAEAGGARAAGRPGGARRREQAAEGRHAHVPHELVHLGRERELAVARQAVEQFRHEGVEPRRPDVSRGAPQHFNRGGHGRAVDARAPSAPRRRLRPGRAAQQTDRRLAVEASDRNDLVESAPFPTRVAAKYRSRCTAAYSRRLARVTDTSVTLEWVTVTSALGAFVR